MSVIYESVNHSILTETFKISTFQFVNRNFGQILQFDNSKTKKNHFDDVLNSHYFR